MSGTKRTGGWWDGGGGGGNGSNSYTSFILHTILTLNYQKRRFIQNDLFLKDSRSVMFHFNKHVLYQELGAEG